MKTAQETTATVGGFAGPARHYKLSEPLCGHDHVIVWTQEAFGRQSAEAVVVAANPNGSASTMNRLPGSFVHTDVTHEAALDLAGYTVVPA